MEFFLCVIGMVLVVEGMPYFLFPDKMKRMMHILLEQDDKTLRTYGAAIMLVGLLVVYMARSALGYL
ncbi:MAG: DUF2065 domain-containing protein [Desulfomonilaceae bacterium]|jgi:uncharacterized protein|nr:DUF2065 domain-containing protein [Desulfomonilaceae bacterium]